MALGIVVADFVVWIDKILGHLFVSIRGNEKQGQSFIGCRSISELSEKKRQS